MNFLGIADSIFWAEDVLGDSGKGVTMTMQARISTIEGDGSKIDDAIKIIDEKILPALKALDGFRAANFLV
ncbi:MAG: hypothetical protein ACRD1T_18005, partial [Acidimicrobiia bacterium]